MINKVKLLVIAYGKLVGTVPRKILKNGFSEMAFLSIKSSYCMHF